MELSKLTAEHKGTSCKSFIAKDLEDIFLNLSEDDMQSIVGLIPKEEEIAPLEYEALNEVANFLLINEEKTTKDKYIVPDFDEKIKFNKLGSVCEGLLKKGSYQAYSLEKYFTSSSNFIRERLKNAFKKMYVESKSKFSQLTSEDGLADSEFFYILTNSVKHQMSKAEHNAVIVLMSYYFENCDIFEAPK